MSNKGEGKWDLKANGRKEVIRGIEDKERGEMCKIGKEGKE